MESNTEILAKYLVSLVENPVVLFRYSAQSWTTDCLVATIQNPKDPQRFYILGISNALPGWDEEATGPKDSAGWDRLTGTLEVWIKEMNAAAKTAVIPDLTIGLGGRPSFQRDSKPNWVFWVPDNGTFNSVRDLTHDPRVIAAPDGVVDQVEELHRQYQDAKELTQMKQKLAMVQKRIAGVHESLDSLEAEKRQLEEEIKEFGKNN